VPGDYAAALSWYRKAADQGYAAAQNNLGLAYTNGYGAARDYVAALNWFRKAADQGYAAAEYNLGSAYANGRGVSQDYDTAYMWFNLAAEAGYTDAARERDKVTVSRFEARLEIAKLMVIITLNVGGNAILKRPSGHRASKANGKHESGDGCFEGTVHPHRPPVEPCMRSAEKRQGCVRAGSARASGAAATRAARNAGPDAPKIAREKHRRLDFRGGALPTTPAGRECPPRSNRLTVGAATSAARGRGRSRSIQEPSAQSNTGPGQLSLYENSTGTTAAPWPDDAARPAVISCPRHAR
jgi:TPR repeat protein